MAQEPVKRYPNGRAIRISAKVRDTIALRVGHGLSWAEAAKRAGMSQAGIHKARTRPEVQAEIERQQAAYVADLEALKAPHKARALEVARYLLDNSKSDNVRARMVEFFRDEGPRGPQVVVNTQINAGVKGYEYAPPGARIVDITPAQDTDKDPD